MGRLTEIMNNCAPTGSVLDVSVKNASINVDVTVADYVSVTQSGAFISTSGQASVTQVTNPWIVLGSQAITNTPDTNILFFPTGRTKDYYTGITIAGSGQAATLVSGVYTPDGANHLKDITILKDGVGTGDACHIRHSGASTVWLVSGAYLQGDANHTYTQDMPYSTGSNTQLTIFVNLAVAADANVNALVHEYR